MTNKLKAGRTYRIDQGQYLLHCILEDNERYCCGLARNESGVCFQIKQYKQQLTDDMKLARRELAHQDLLEPTEAREFVRGRAVKYENCVIEPHSGTTFAGYLNIEADSGSPLAWNFNYGSERSHIDKAIELCQLLQSIHTKGYSLGGLSFSNIEVMTDGLRLTNVEFAQKADQKDRVKHDINQLCQILKLVPKLEPSLLHFLSLDDKLKTSITAPTLQAEQIGAILVLNQAGNNAYQRVIQKPYLAKAILQKYKQHKDNPADLNIAIKYIVRSSFRQLFADIRNQRSESPDSNASTALSDLDEFSSSRIISRP